MPVKTLNKDSTGRPPQKHPPDGKGTTLTSFESSDSELLNQLLEKREAIRKYETALRTVIQTHEVDSQSVLRLSHTLAINESENERLEALYAELLHSFSERDKAARHFENTARIQGERIDRLTRVNNYYATRNRLLEIELNRQQAVFSDWETRFRRYVRELEAHHHSRYEHELEKRRFLQKSWYWKVRKWFGMRLPNRNGEIARPAEPLGWEFLRSLETAENPVEPLPNLNLPTPPVSIPYSKTSQKDKPIAIGYHCGLDAPKSDITKFLGYRVHVAGWAVDARGRRPQSVWVSVGSRRYPCSLGRMRPDVVHAFEGQLEIDPNCGFFFDVDTGPGMNVITVEAEFQDGKSGTLFTRIIYNLGLMTAPKGQLDQDYQTWASIFDTVSEDDIENVNAHIRTFSYQPGISLLLPVYNSNEKFLVQAIESVIGQLYENWELCIADDASTKPYIRDILKSYARKDSRIKVVFREENGHISAATNSALQIAHGEYCALLDHDDTLSPLALYFIVQELQEHPEADLLYSDEDKIDPDGTRFDPYFKSDWNLDLFLSHNCVSHLGVYRTAILREIGGFDEALYGSQDWDMALRFVARIGEQNIRHIPRVLYHWRYTDTSTAHSIESKPYVVNAGRKAIEAFLASRKTVAKVDDGPWAGSFRVKYSIPRRVHATILIPTHGDYETARRCIESVLTKTSYPHYDILALNNQRYNTALTGYLNQVQNSAKVGVREYDGEFSYGPIYNYGAGESQGEVLVFMDTDIEVIEDGWLEEVVSHAIRPEIGAVGVRLLYPDHTVQHGGVVMGIGGVTGNAFQHISEWDIGHMGRAHLQQNYSAVSGACIATRRDVFDQLNGFNSVDLPMVYGDIDYCLRAQHDLGLKTLWTPFVNLIHHESVPTGIEVDEEKTNRIIKEGHFMNRQWKAVIENDPYYNPNLTLNGFNFFYAWPPRIDKPWKQNVT